ncbi:MAG: DMT family transporter [Deltaproteobacteria bacterium]|nr:DMT family transporter [Deltaproteobacteria bacterium]MBI2182305.1 DMT family transporter [Deltaproteobacteria bacterium]MBI2227907.1 DMT family transporter [Deltaproteobacteria bacterium]MBI2367710.1 DMT family transporter [Deltaproteobacteria bacterium]MBI2531301.1 DMT family transporter [Deltaproteobacteria bacterium]
MSSELWAIISAAAWAADSILVRKGTAFSNPSTAALVSFFVNTAILGPYLFFQYPLEKIFQPANLFFVVSGIIQPAIVRVLFYVGIVRLGVSRAGPIRGTSPFFSVAIAFFLFQDRPGLIVYLGGILTVAGTWLVSYKRAGEAKWRPRDLLFPLGAAMIASVSQNIRKMGLNSTSEPIIAATVSTATSLFCLFGSVLFSGNMRSIQINRPCLPYYGGAAVFALIGQLCTFIALNGGQISVVAPLINTTPLFVIGLTALFLRGEEKINRSVVIGVVLLVAGIVAITGR